jgi:hypothetical protein
MQKQVYSLSQVTLVENKRKEEAPQKAKWPFWVSPLASLSFYAKNGISYLDPFKE